jgi:hypothetical protein
MIENIKGTGGSGIGIAGNSSVAGGLTQMGTAATAGGGTS